MLLCGFVDASCLEWATYLSGLKSSGLGVSRRRLHIGIMRVVIIILAFYTFLDGLIKEKNGTYVRLALMSDNFKAMSYFNQQLGIVSTVSPIQGVASLNRESV